MNLMRRIVVALVAATLSLLMPGIAGAEWTEVAEEFEFTGAAQNWAPPPGVTEATFVLLGAAGGAGSDPSFPPHAPGGKGARLSATVPVQPGFEYLLYVGGAAPGLGRDAGGYNGGGGGIHTGGVPHLGGGGGGASDVRVGPLLADRMLVAGGGGGGAGRGHGTGPVGGGGVAGGAGGG